MKHLCWVVLARFKGDRVFLDSRSAAAPALFRRRWSPAFMESSRCAQAI